MDTRGKPKSKSKSKGRMIRHNNRDHSHFRPQSADPLIALIEVMSQLNRDPQILVPLNSTIEESQEDFEDRSFIISGPSGSGKMSTIQWLTRTETDRKRIVLDCGRFTSELQFIEELTKEVGYYCDLPLTRQTVVSDKIDFTELTKIITSHASSLQIIIKSAQLLAKSKKQVVLYTLLQWMNNSFIKENVTFIFCTKSLTFMQKLQKRVKSRMNLPFLFLTRAPPAMILKIINERVEWRLRQQKNKKGQQLLESLSEALNSKQVLKKVKASFEKSPQSITYYLEQMKLTLATHSLEQWCSLQQGEVNSQLIKGLASDSSNVVELNTLHRNLFSQCSLPAIILLGLIRRAFIIQERGAGFFNQPITFNTLMKNWDLFKSELFIQQVGSSFLYHHNQMQQALHELLSLKIISLIHQAGIGITEMELNMNNGPEDFERFYQSLSISDLPAIVKKIYSQYK